MGSLVMRIAGAVGAAALSVAIFGSGLGSAEGPALAGKTYSEASGIISKWGGTPVIATVSGNQLTMNDCIVVSYTMSNFLNSRGKNERASNYLLHLNCNNRVAAAGKPGNSAMSEEGAQEKLNQKYAVMIAKNPERCEKNEGAMAWCKKICKDTGLCEL